VDKTRKGLGVWISWTLARLPAAQSASPASQVTREHVRSYIVELQSFRAPNTVFCRAQELYDAIRVMEPDRDWSWLLCAVKKLRSRAKPVREKLPRLKPADIIERLGLDLMERAETEQGLSPFKRALMFRDGLAIAFLIRRPLRLRNFAGIRIGIHLVGDGLSKITLRPAEMKSKRPFEAAFPTNLQQPLCRYLQVYRPYLLSMGSAQTGAGGSLIRETALWVSREGRAVDPGAFSKSITRRTRAAFGRDLTPHLFRDASVTTLIRDAPASALLTKAILGHGSIDITYNHYNQAQMIESSRRHANLVAALQQHDSGGS
jgi:integrase/recombinase XerC